MRSVPLQFLWFFFIQYFGLLVKISSFWAWTGYFVWIQDRAMESVASGSCCILRYSDLNSQQHGAMGPVAHDDQIVPDSSSWSSSSPNSTGFTCFDSFLQMQVSFNSFFEHSTSYIFFYKMKYNDNLIWNVYSLHARCLDFSFF